MFGQEDLTRILVAARPSYKINDNLRFEMTGSVSKETIADGAAWGRQDDNMYYMLEAALPVTVNADYFGRPQIKPYVTYYNTEEESAGGIGLGGTDGKEVIVGIHTEIWF
jgi:maltoporin